MTDNLSVGVVTARYLNKHGFGVSTASDLKAAVTKFAAASIDIVILDDFDNGEGSLKILKVLRDLEAGGGTVPVLMAGSITWAASVELEAKRLGVTRFLFEPFADMPKLLEIVSSSLSESGGEDVSEKPAEELLDELLEDFDIDVDFDEAGEQANSTASPLPIGSGEHLIGGASAHFEVKGPFQTIGVIKTAAHGPEQPLSPPHSSETPARQHESPQLSEDAHGRSREEAGSDDEDDQTEKGSLAKRDVAELFAGFCRDQATGVLYLRQGSVDKTLVFEKGSPVNVESCLPVESFGAYLERMGRLTKEQLTTIEGERGGEGREIELLVARGWLNPNEIFTSITEHVTETTLSCFAWTDGEYRFSRGDGPGGNIPLRLDMPRLVLDGIKRHYNLSRLNKHLALTNETVLLLKEGGGEIKPADLKLTTSEARIFENLKHGATFGELQMMGSDKSVDILALLYGLRVLGLLLRDTGHHAHRPSASPSGRFVHVTSPPPRRTSPPPRRTPRSGKPSTPSATSQKDPEGPSSEDEMLRDLNELKDADYFKLLGLSRSAEINEIHGAFRKQVKRFHQDKLAQLTPEIQGKGKKVYLRLMEGYKVLTDSEQREQYLAELEENDPSPVEEPTPSSSADPSSSHSSPPTNPRINSSSVPDSPDSQEEDLEGQLERIIARVQEFLLADKFTAAVSVLENALGEAYEKVRLHAWLGWVLYNKSPDKLMGEAEAQLAEARRADPNHPEPYLFMARIREAEGNAEQAHTFFKKAADVAPRDRVMVKTLQDFEKRLQKDTLNIRKASPPPRGSKTPTKSKGRPKAKPKNEPKGVLDQDVGQIFKSIFKKKG